MENEMSETKFTKGEWFAIVDDECCFIDNCEKGLIADLEESDAPCDEAEANAHLIAAAPDMYAQLESVIGELFMLIDEVNDQRASRINSQTETEPDYHDMETLHNIQILLAKARGEK